MKLPRYSALLGIALIATAKIQAQAALDPFSLEFEFPIDPTYADSTITWTEISPGVFTPTDWDIHGPLGEFTPSNSAIDSSSLGAPGFLLSPTEIPLDQLNIVDTDPPISGSYTLSFGGEHFGGTIQATGHDAVRGLWAVPDRAVTASLLVGGLIGLWAFGRRRSRAEWRVMSDDGQVTSDV